MADQAIATDANEDRGEFSLILDGESMVMRPSYEAIDAFERATGKGLIDLTRAALAGALTLGETAVIACECIRAWGRANNSSARGVQASRIAELIMESQGGLIATTPIVGAMLALAATGGVTASGEVKATTTPTTAI